jgi:Leucine-rich repeat (LRR) protein
MIVHAVFLLWGLLILGIHVRTAFHANISREGSPAGCVQPLRPWFATRPACSVFRYSCLNDNATSPIEESLAAIDAYSLSSLILLDCAELRMSKMLQSFPKMIEFEIWRSHIAQWDKDAALTATAHPNLVYCGLIQTTMHEIPAGLRYNLPPSLQDIEIAHCNLTTLPDDLDIAWANVGTLYIEHCNLREFPAVVKRMTIDDLSFVGNEISELPDSLVPHDVFSLALSGNPITTISNSTLPDGGQLTFLALENTLVRELPLWVHDVTHRADAKVFMHGTPFCANKSPEEIAEQFGSGSSVTCEDSNPRSGGRYPLDLVIELRREENSR